tara:strand:+ start:590 stop:1129 length:540 start_codon:yes stop_codon:yes gene_type:complete
LATPLYDAIEFMKSFGIFDVVLPFLLVFTVIFGVLEKTKLFGKEGDSSRKNINAMVAFTIGFFVVAATQVVTVIQTALPYIMLLLILIITFMILYGSTLSEGEINVWEHFEKHKGIFAFGLFIAILAIVLGAMDMLGGLVNWVYQTVTAPVIYTIVLLLVVAIFMWVVIGKSHSGESSD